MGRFAHSRPKALHQVAEIDQDSSPALLASPQVGARRHPGNPDADGGQIGDVNAVPVRADEHTAPDGGGPWRVRHHHAQHRGQARHHGQQRKSVAYGSRRIGHFLDRSEAGDA